MSKRLKAYLKRSLNPLELTSLENNRISELGVDGFDDFLSNFELILNLFLLATKYCDVSIAIVISTGV